MPHWKTFVVLSLPFRSRVRSISIERLRYIAHFPQIYNYILIELKRKCLELVFVSDTSFRFLILLQAFDDLPDEMVNELVKHMSPLAATLFAQTSRKYHDLYWHLISPAHLLMGEVARGNYVSCLKFFAPYQSNPLQTLKSFIDSGNVEVLPPYLLAVALPC